MDQQPGVDDAEAARGWAEVAQRRWQPPARRTIIVTPHPDDEVLGCGGLIARQCSRGLEVIVIAVTDGEAAFGDADEGDDDEGSATGFAALAERRRREQLAACAVLGVPPQSVIRLGLPDGRVGLHEAAISDAVATWCRKDDLVVAPWTGDHHCDHEAVGRAVARVTAPSGVLSLGFLVWGPLRSPVPPADRLPLWSLRLTPTEQRLRLDALRCHASQLGAASRAAVVTPALASRLAEPEERYVPPPRTSRR